MESESYTITIQNSTHHNSIPNHSDWDSTIDINQNQFRIQLSLESESESFFDSDSRVWIAPGLNHFPVIIMLVCKINMFLKSDKHNSVVYLLSYFYVINFVWFSGYKKLLGNWNVLLIVLKYILKVLGMYLSTFPQKGMYLYKFKYFRDGKYLYLSTFKVLLPGSAIECKKIFGKRLDVHARMLRIVNVIVLLLGTVFESW